MLLCLDDVYELNHVLKVHWIFPDKLSGRKPKCKFVTVSSEGRTNGSLPTLILFVLDFRDFPALS